MSRRHPEDPPGYNRRWPADRPVRTCSIDGCGEPHASRGYCNLHYTRLKKYGDPNFTQRVYGVKRRKDAAGYVWLYEPTHPLAQTHGYVAEHRKVMWEAGLLTDLTAHVHHRNHDKGDNRLENLEVLTAEQHTRRHLAEEGKVTNQYGTWGFRPPKPERPGPRPCRVCPTVIPDEARTDKVYCSVRCREAAFEQRRRARLIRTAA